MNFLLTNDDGIDAPGLAALSDAISNIARKSGHHTVAPRGAMSGISHRVTMSGPISLERRGKSRYSLGGTPADCVRVALAHLHLDPEWVIAGINRGGNLGADLYTSGTVAAAREAAFFGKKAIAISQYVAKDRKPDWNLSTHLAGTVIADILKRPQTPNSFWNVNLPHPTGEGASENPPIVLCPPDISPLDVTYIARDGHLDYAGSYHERPRQPGCDIDVCFNGSVAVSEIPLRLI